MNSQKATSQSSNSVQFDPFLKRKQIQIQRSDFLSNHYASKSLNLRQSYNPKDIHGKRLSSYWKQGDTLYTVILKKMKHNLLKAFDPDTYTANNLIKNKQSIIKDKFNVIAFIIAIVAPLLIVHPLIKPRLKAIRRQMLFQYYLKSSIISRQLKAPMVKIPKEQMEKIINQANQKIGF